MREDALEKFKCRVCGREIQSFVSQETGELEVTGITEFCRTCKRYSSFKRVGEVITSDNVISPHKLTFWDNAKTEWKKGEK